MDVREKKKVVIGWSVDRELCVSSLLFCLSLRPQLTTSFRGESEGRDR